QALAEAQEKGYAEKNPANDLKGLDTAAKIVIISNWVLKRRISINELEIIGIQNISPEKIRTAKKSGARIKLIGSLTGLQAIVKPEPVPAADPLCVPGNLNALSFSTEHIGDVTVIGRGAGGEETASAIIRDLDDIRNEYSIQGRKLKLVVKYGGSSLANAARIKTAARIDQRFSPQYKTIVVASAI